MQYPVSIPKFKHLRLNNQPDNRDDNHKYQLQRDDDQVPHHSRNISVYFSVFPGRLPYRIYGFCVKTYGKSGWDDLDNDSDDPGDDYLLGGEIWTVTFQVFKHYHYRGYFDCDHVGENYETAYYHPPLNPFVGCLA